MTPPFLAFPPTTTFNQTNDDPHNELYVYSTFTRLYQQKNPAAFSVLGFGGRTDGRTAFFLFSLFCLARLFLIFIFILHHHPSAMVWNGGKGKKEGAFYFQFFIFFGHVLLGIMIVALWLLFLPVFF